MTDSAESKRYVEDFKLAWDLEGGPAHGDEHDLMAYRAWRGLRWLARRSDSPFARTNFPEEANKWLLVSSLAALGRSGERLPRREGQVINWLAKCVSQITDVRWAHKLAVTPAPSPKKFEMWLKAFFQNLKLTLNEGGQRERSKLPPEFWPWFSAVLSLATRHRYDKRQETDADQRGRLWDREVAGWNAPKHGGGKEPGPWHAAKGFSETSSLSSGSSEDDLLLLPGGVQHHHVAHALPGVSQQTPAPPVSPAPVLSPDPLVSHPPAFPTAFPVNPVSDTPAVVPFFVPRPKINSPFLHAFTSLDDIKTKLIKGNLIWSQDREVALAVDMTWRHTLDSLRSAKVTEERILEGLNLGRSNYIENGVGTVIPQIRDGALDLVEMTRLQCSAILFAIVFGQHTSSDSDRQVSLNKLLSSPVVSQETNPTRQQNYGVLIASILAYWIYLSDFKSKDDGRYQVLMKTTVQWERSRVVERTDEVLKKVPDRLYGVVTISSEQNLQDTLEANVIVTFAEEYVAYDVLNETASSQTVVLFGSRPEALVSSIVFSQALQKDAVYFILGTLQTSVVTGIALGEDRARVTLAKVLLPGDSQSEVALATLKSDSNEAPLRKRWVRSRQINPLQADHLKAQFALYYLAAKGPPSWTGKYVHNIRLAVGDWGGTRLIEEKEMPSGPGMTLAQNIRVNRFLTYVLAAGAVTQNFPNYTIVYYDPDILNALKASDFSQSFKGLDTASVSEEISDLKNEVAKRMVPKQPWPQEMYQLLRPMVGLG